MTRADERFFFVKVIKIRIKSLAARKTVLKDKKRARLDIGFSNRHPSEKTDIRIAIVI